MPKKSSSLKSMLRHAVSKNHSRFISKSEDGSDMWDLDLSYISPNIIAMAAPAGNFWNQHQLSTSGGASGVFGGGGGDFRGASRLRVSLFASLYSSIESWFRNSSLELSSFLDTKHGVFYKVYNLCSETNRLYDPSLFGGRLASFPFDDHHVPPLTLIVAFTASASSWLAQHTEHVVAIHCKAGKSRTGLMVCALLVKLGVVEDANAAEELYNRKRTNDGKGLTLPSQRRYLRYFYEALNKPDDAHETPPRVGVSAVYLYGTAARLAASLGPGHFRTRVLAGVSTEGKAIEGSRRWELVDDGSGVECLRIPLSPPAVISGDFLILLGANNRPFWAHMHTSYLPMPAHDDGTNAVSASTPSEVALTGAELDNFTKSLHAAAMSEEVDDAQDERCVMITVVRA